MTHPLNSCKVCQGQAYAVSVQVYRHGSRWYSVNCKQCSNTLRRFETSEVQAAIAWNDLNTPRARVARPAAAQAPA